MIDPTWIEFAKSLSTMTLGPLLVLILITGYRQTWVWGWQLKSMTSDRDFWREHALLSMKIAEKTTAATGTPSV